MKDHPRSNRYTGVANIDCKGVDSSHAASYLSVTGVLIWWRTFKYC